MTIENSEFWWISSDQTWG